MSAQTTPTAYGATEPLVGGPNGVPLAYELQWKAGVFGCFTDCWPNCAMAFFCPCVSLAQTLHRVGVYSYTVGLLVFGVLYAVMGISDYIQFTRNVDDNDDMWGPADSWATVYILLGAVNVILVMRVRAAVRDLQHIQGGSVCEDFWCVLCCQCCIIAQLATEVHAYDKGECQFGPKDSLPGYVV
ncbi:hypothetical protein DYB28_003041 [Aphanomyces astaci]|uniref:PLAC8 family protein n=1 Tax=Aphanomyces astaci TaxID=112090 RepID=A0A397C9I9_APHAT|nr:hypothetical protein AaE_001179 [Aphanomyces astaci]RHY39481.1 hypothetical protein DYB30_008816 [Aphanomyces astaci]RHZ42600.1 hypothetical protein DYB26_015115 [Aphanomyces astaci]RLO08471.1 hypothetical protein DYB28_003041 [Aphanomyces astaci]